MEIVTIIGDKVILHWVYYEEEYYSDYFPDIQMMVNSFEIAY